MTLFIILITLNIATWCWLAAKAATEPDIESGPVESLQRHAMPH